MFAVFFLIYTAIGLGGGYALWSQFAIDPILSACAGGVVTIFLIQLHMLMTRGKSEQRKIGARIDAVEIAQKDSASRAVILEARTDAIESTLNHELTERRDALVNEMRQLEGLIGRLTSKIGRAHV